MRKYLLLFFLAGTLVMIVVMARTGTPLKTPSTPNGILNLEFAYNGEKVNTVLNAWSTVNTADIISAARLNTWLDFIFLFFYSVFLFLAAQSISQLYGGIFGRAGKIIAKGALFAGFLDVLENTGMLISMAGKGSDAIAFCTCLFSLIKWGLALLALLYVITGATGLLRAKLMRMK